MSQKNGIISFGIGIVLLAVAIFVWSRQLNPPRIHKPAANYYTGPFRSSKNADQFADDYGNIVKIPEETRKAREAQARKATPVTAPAPAGGGPKKD